ncbi:MAG TPA: Holliday junction branch migration protein RuvA [Fastidiosipila sp.]|nr:Holliday junction branch migration protein RuvA [Fastidiosipila sp.]
MSIMDYISGEIVDKEPERIVVETGGIGFDLLIHPGFASRFPAIGEKTKVYCHLHVREDVMQLYAFPGIDEKALFLQLITVSGIGPKVALTIVGSIDPGAFALAILGSDIKTLTTIKGIGKKGAERLIVEMKDKVKKTMTPSPVGTSLPSVIPSGVSEALEALLVLGYRQDEAEHAIAQIDTAGDTSVEAVIRAALQVLAKKRERR